MHNRPHPAAARALTIFAAGIAMLSALAACTPDAGPPSPAATAEQSSADRDQAWGTAMAECLADAGWEVQVGSDGSISPVGGVPVDQAGQYDSAVSSCEEPLNANVTPLDELSADQWDDLYRQESATAECLRAEGIDVPQIPSRATFVDQYQSSDPWTSYGFVGLVDESEWTHLNSTCPQPYIG